MGMASYAIVAQRKGWCILHDGNAEGDYETREAAFEAAMTAASLAVRQGHEIHISVPAMVADKANTTTKSAPTDPIWA